MDEYSNLESVGFHEFRAKGLGSSDMPVIMGVSPYKTRYQLWLEKTGKKLDDFAGNWATQRGTDLEPIVRDMYNTHTGLEMIPERTIHPSVPYFRCNADGVDHNAKRMIEIKCGSKDGHYAIPDKYYPQIMFLSYMFGYEIDYVSYWNNEINIIPVEANQDYTSKMIAEAHKFWDLIITRTPPDLVDEDEIVLDSQELKDLLEEYEETKSIIDLNTAKLKTLQNSISEKVTSKKAVCGSYKLNWVDKKGSINYKAIPVLKDYDLEEFRMPSTRYFSIRRGDAK